MKLFLAIRASLMVLLLLNTHIEQARAANSQLASIEVRISTVKNVSNVGEIVRVKVELVNTAEVTILVGKEIEPTFFNFPFTIDFSLEDELGKPALHRGAAVLDFPPTDLRKMEGCTFKWWVSLPPGSSYARTVRVNYQSDLRRLRPGSYRLKAKYSSVGLPQASDDTSSGKESCAGSELVHPAFKGTVESNSIWLTFVDKVNRQPGR